MVSNSKIKICKIAKICIIFTFITFYSCKSTYYANRATSDNYYMYNDSIFDSEYYINVNDWEDKVEKEGSYEKILERVICTKDGSLNVVDTCYLYHLYNSSTEIRRCITYDSKGRINKLKWYWKEIPIGKEYRYNNDTIMVHNWDEGYLFSGIHALYLVKKKYKDSFCDSCPLYISKKYYKGKNTYIISFFHNSKGLTSVMVNGKTGRIFGERCNLKIYY